MREMIFKAKRVDNGEWVEGGYVQFYEHYIYQCESVFGSPHDMLAKYEVDPETVCQFTEFTTLGKKIKVFENDKWELHFYSQLSNGHVHNQGFVKRLKNGMWVCQEEPGVNSFELESMVEDYQGAFEIISNIHDKKEGK